MKKLVLNILSMFLTRRSLWRLGRAMYLKARADTTNELETNGEKYVQFKILKNLMHSAERLVFFDIGSNIGDWTLTVTDQAQDLGVDEKLEVHAFEPVPSTFHTLEKRISEKQKSRAASILINQGLSDVEGNSNIFIIGENAGTNSLYPDALHPSNTLQKISLTTGDNYCAAHEIGKVHFIKCDAEGHDFNVLRGFKSLIESENMLVFQFEYTHFWVYSRHYLKDVFDFIEKYPSYKIGKITPGGIEIYEKWHPELEKFFAGNYLIIHQSALGWFDLVRGEFDVFDTYGTARMK